MMEYWKAGIMEYWNDGMMGLKVPSSAKYSIIPIVNLR
jgi:hypothetical protein